METIYKQKYAQARQLRKEFMQAMIEEGKEIIETLKSEKPRLYEALQLRFGTQTARAAFWLMNERDAQSQSTPLQKLVNGSDKDFLVQLRSPQSLKGFGL